MTNLERYDGRIVLRVLPAWKRWLYKGPVLLIAEVLAIFAGTILKVGAGVLIAMFLWDVWNDMAIGGIYFLGISIFLMIASVLCRNFVLYIKHQRGVR